MLIEKKNEILKRSSSLTVQDVRELPDSLDFATAIIQNSIDDAVNVKDKRLLIEVEDALRRMEDGEYGYCEGSGDVIPKKRLMIQPWARYTVSYQERVDRMSGKKRFRGIIDEETRG